MFFKALIALTLMLVSPDSAGAEAYAPGPKLTGREKTDSLKQKVTRTAKGVDAWLLKRQQRQKTDTDYIFKPQERWMVRTRGDVAQSFVSFGNSLENKTDVFQLTLHTNPKYKQHFGFGYRGVVLGFGIGFSKKKSDKELSIKYYGNRFGVEATFGFLGSLTGKLKIPGYEASVAEGTLDCDYLHLGGYYAFRGDKFSMPAAMNQSFIQRKSAGSPLATAHFRMIMFGFEEDKQSSSLFDTMSLFFGLGGGYGYNWVPSEHWLLHISATETLGFLGNTRLRTSLAPGETFKAHGRFIPLFTKGNVAALYYYKIFYGGIFGTVDNMFIPSKLKGSDERYQISVTRIQGHITVGVRF